jgi:hypothetical protein
MRPITVQTGSYKGTYKLGDQHPFISDRVFKQYSKNKDGSFREVWVTPTGYVRVVDTERFKKYQIANKERLREYRRTSPARKASKAAYRVGLHKSYTSLPENSKAVVRGIYEASQRVSECLGVPFHVDHIVPVSKGGTHSPENLQIVPAKWNLQKGNRHSGGFDEKI